MKVRGATYLLDRSRLAYGRSAAAILDLAFLRRNHGVELQRLGTEYGGWYCVTGLLRAGQLAMCCGAGEDVSFDVALNARMGMRIVCVDPTPRSIAHVSALLRAAGNGTPMLVEAGPQAYDLAGFRPADFQFVPSAVWSKDGDLELFAPRDPAHVSYSAVNLQGTKDLIRVPARRISTLMRELGIAEIALLKLDIEGAEYEVLGRMLDDGVRPAQLLIEFDHVNQPQSALFWRDLAATLGRLAGAGYQLIHRERANYLFVLQS